VQYNNVSVNTMNKSVGSYTRKDHTHARIKTKQITKLYRCTGFKMASLRFHGFLLAQLVPLLQHGGLESPVLGFLRGELGECWGVLGVPPLVQVLILLPLLFLLLLSLRGWHLRLGSLEQGDQYFCSLSHLTLFTLPTERRVHRFSLSGIAEITCIDCSVFPEFMKQTKSTF